MKLPPIPDLRDAALDAALQRAIDHKTKPQGSLGRIEQLALQAGRVLGTDKPKLVQPQLVVFAADHGIAAHGVSAFPQEVTGQMVRNFLAGGAAVSVLARQHGLAMTVVDCGVACDFEPHPQLRPLKVAKGAADPATGPAMSRGQCEAAMRHGMELVQGLPGNALLVGEMGIANSSPAALLLARLTGAPLGECVGRGTGLDDAGLQRKKDVLQRVLDRHADARAPLDALAAFGGLEIATMAGAILQAASERRIVVMDGFITGAALLVAHAVAPHVVQRCIFSHRSAEPGHALMLGALGARPLLELDLRLGEGSGAALAWPLVVSACMLLCDMATFDSAQVSGKH
ncbi:nicotinate-nucleotide--dimethylbenzimidazole phosphoribosyltransferase [Ramlibacter sp. PS4R-6]|uniref:nicotinate-nucleotide--dimethylbenzimidazole phosphoribosyltransferase n=1 Tax=Ramlibacter sp. PS4R-6 TaxID=3133438 RepID=UPI0030B0C94F